MMAGVYHDPENMTWLPQRSLVHDTAACTIIIQTFIDPITSSPITAAQCTFPPFRCTTSITFIHGIVKGKSQATANFRVAVAYND
jgi:hypothetical protein